MKIRSTPPLEGVRPDEGGNPEFLARWPDQEGKRQFWLPGDFLTTMPRGARQTILRVSDTAQDEYRKFVFTATRADVKMGNEKLMEPFAAWVLEHFPDVKRTPTPLWLAWRATGATADEFPPGPPPAPAPAPQPPAPVGALPPGAIAPVVPAPPPPVEVVPPAPQPAPTPPPVRPQERPSMSLLDELTKIKPILDRIQGTSDALEELQAAYLEIRAAIGKMAAALKKAGVKL